VDIFHEKKHLIGNLASELLADGTLAKVRKALQ
jgi:hypothetical protein